MNTTPLDAVTGAYGYTGKYITRLLLGKGRRVIALTNSPGRPNEFGDRVPAYPYNFENPQALEESLGGVEVLYNTYWVRFNHPAFNHEQAVANAGALFEAARRAGVKRVVHISITNPTEDSPYEYFSGKARMEKMLIQTGLSYAILRPAIIFGPEDILINNIAWALRRLPVFGLFGDGKYRLRPIFVEDLARLAVKYAESDENVVLDATGPEVFTYRELVQAIGRLIGANRPVIPLPPTLGFLASQVIGALTGDVFVTRPEIEGLMADLLYSAAPPTGETRLTDWVAQHRDTLGRRYASELKRRLDRTAGYPQN